MNDHFISIAKDSMLMFFKTAFGSPNLFGNGVNPYLYSEDEKTTKIMIADSNTENLESISLKPAILTQRAQTFPRQLGLGDKSKQGFGNTEERSVLMNVGLSLNCYAREGLEAESLAVIVFQMLRFMNEQIQKTFKIFDINVQGIGSEQPVERTSVSELVMVPVMVTLAVPCSIRINFNAIQLNKLYLEGVAYSASSVDSQGKTS